MKIRALLTAGFAAALAAGAFAGPGSAIAASAQHNPNTQSLSTASFRTASGGIAVGKEAGIIPARNAGLGGRAVAPQVGAAPASCSEPDCNLTYNGGPVQHSTHVYLLFWGPKWNTNATDKAAAKYLIAFYKGLGQARDAWTTITAQYGDTSGRPGFGKSLFAASHVVTSNPPNPLTLNDLGQEAANAASIFKISTGAAHNVQIIIASQSGTCFSPPGAGQPNFVGNCGKAPTPTSTGYCGFHNFDFDPQNQSVFLPWVNLPFQLDARADCGQDFINGGSRGTFDGFSITTGHETAETITDPEESAWFDASDGVSGGEIADKCAWEGSAWNQSPPDPAGNLGLGTGSFAAQSLWSNLLNKCVMSGALPITIGFISNQSSTIGKAVSLQVVASTNPATALSFRASGLPAGLTMSKAGLIHGTPGVTAGTFKVQVTISYVTGSKSFSFLWRVASAPGQVQGFDAKCVDDAGAHTNSGNKIDLFTCSGKAQQMITFTAGGELRVLTGCITGTTTAFFNACKGATSQVWTRHANGEYVLKANGKCLTDPGNSKNNGTKLTLAACKNTANQHWSLP